MTEVLHGAARTIKNRLDAHAVDLVFLENDEDPEALSIKAEFKGPKGRLQYYVHVEPFPLRPNWQERAIQNLRHERERA